MRIKKVLSLAVVLAMVLTVVPMFGITAGAAAGQDNKPVLSSLTPEFNGAKEESYSDKPVNEVYTDWMSTVTGKGHVNVNTYSGYGEKGTTLQFFAGNWGSGQVGEASTATVKTPGYAKNKDVVVLEWYNEFNDEGDNYRTFKFKDTEDNDIDSYEIDRKVSGYGKDFIRGFGLPKNNAKYTFVAVNNENTTHSTFYYINDKLCVKKENLSGNFNGFGSIECSMGQYNSNGRNFGFTDLKIYSGEKGIISVTVKIAESGQEPMKTFKENVMVGSEYTPNDYYIDAVGGKVYKLTPVQITAGMEEVTITATPFRKIETTNLISNGSFENGGNFDTTGWFSAQDETDIPNPTSDSENHFIAVKKDDKYYFTGSPNDFGAGTISGITADKADPTDGDWYLMGKWGDPYDGLCSLKRSFDLTPGASYIFSFDAKTLDGVSTGETIHFGLTRSGRDIPDENAALAEKSTGVLDSSWRTVSAVFDATDDKNSIQFRAWSISNDGNHGLSAKICFDNFRLYKLEPLDTQTEVKATYKYGENTVYEKYATYENGGDGVTLDEEYVYSDGEIYRLPEVKLTGSQEVKEGVEKIARYTSRTPDVPFSVDGVNYYKLAKDAESVVVNGNFIAEKTYGWTSRWGKNGTDVTGDTYVKEKIDGVETNVLTLNTGGAGASNSIGTAWTVEPGTTYYVSFWQRNGGQSDDLGYNKLNNAHVVTDGNRTASGDSIIDLSKMNQNGYWNHYETIFTASKNEVYFQNSWGTKVGLANFEIIPVDKVGNPEKATISFMNQGAEVATSEVNGPEGAELRVPYQIIKGKDGKNYVLAHQVVKTVESGKVSVDVVPVKAFTWNKANNVIHVQNPGDDLDYATRAISASHDLDRVGYAVVDSVPDGANVLVLDAWFNNVNNSNEQYPLLSFDIVAGADKLSEINLTGGADTASELNELFANPTISVRDFDTTGAVADRSNHYQGKTVKVYVPVEGLSALANNGISVKMTTVDGTIRAGMITVYGVETAKVDLPTAPEAKLGFADGAFFINFEVSDDSKVVVTPEDGTSSDDGKDIETRAQVFNGSVTVDTEKTNRIFEATAINSSGIKSIPVVASIYSLVVNELATSTGVAEDKKDAINAVISKGGVYYSGDDHKLTAEGGNLFESIDVQDTVVTIKVNESIAGYGVGFVLDKDSEVYFGSGEKATVKDEIETAVYDTMTINLTDEGNTVTLSNSYNTQEAITLSLDAVNIEFVETLIDEIEADGAEADVVFTPEI